MVCYLGIKRVFFHTQGMLDEHRRFGNLVDLMDILHMRQLTPQPRAPCSAVHVKKRKTSCYFFHIITQNPNHQNINFFFHKSSQVISVNNPEDKGDEEIVFLLESVLVFRAP